MGNKLTKAELDAETFRAAFVVNSAREVQGQVLVGDGVVADFFDKYVFGDSHLNIEVSSAIMEKADR